MLFNSYEFIFIFLPIVLFLYYGIAKKIGCIYAKYFLIVSSIAFYSYWDIRNLPILLVSIAVNFCIGRKIVDTKEKRWLILGIVFNLLFLAYYKYANFFLDNISALFHTSFSHFDIVLSLGISFFTFTQTAYLVDAYRGETKTYSKSDYLLFVTIFPHLIAGPIIYHKDMIPQFAEEQRYKFNYDNFAKGITWFVIGLFKKVIIADWMSNIANLVFGHSEHLSILEAWGGSLAYTLQLYFDFSGYSEMAIGIALMLNYNLPINFNAPYKACSIIDFWKRWHITLSAFLKNYLYIPLGGNRNGHHMRNIMITMLLGGLWHGAGWTFVIWGGIHGCCICINHLWRKTKLSLPKVVNWLLTFNVVNLAWIFFRAESFEQAFNIIKAMGDLSSFCYPYSKSVVKWLPNLPYNKDFLFPSNDVLWIILFLIISIVYYSTEDWMKEHFKPKAVTAVVLALGFVYAVSQLNKLSAFLYFQF
ncbi:MBOAT family protein [uncultured Phascolarctobacterium sp.]|uniref:MBOAT family O-acyltransferase n=1 Tax=uncultured Phascolarctobacterium sp. TaxID=512296 RepID=UPI002639EBD7|nr:MBOAT family O-acyltransferase [uncultured Phascolarctobacterium sp.]